MTPMPTDLMIELRDIFATRFDQDALNDFALELGVDYENLSGSSKGAKARELALYLWRHSLLTKLAEVGPKRRPEIDWTKTLAPHLGLTDPASQLPVPVPDPRPKLDYRDLQKLIPILAAHTMFQTPDSRQSVLVISGLAPHIHLDLNGNAFVVASNLLAKLNDYGEIAPGDTAIGRLLSYIARDQALPPADKDVITTIAAQNSITLEP